MNFYVEDNVRPGRVMFDIAELIEFFEKEQTLDPALIKESQTSLNQYIAGCKFASHVLHGLLAKYNLAKK